MVKMLWIDQENPHQDEASVWKLIIKLVDFQYLIISIHYWFLPHVMHKNELYFLPLLIASKISDREASGHNFFVNSI